MPVIVLSRRRQAGVTARAVRRDAERAIVALGEASSELTVSLVGDVEMQSLNRDYRGKDHPTDVLAFATREGVRIPGDENQLGDVIISLDTAARQARERGHSVAEEVRTLLVHGILHLLGYDHERSVAEARRMKAKERRLVQVLHQKSAKYGNHNTKRHPAKA